MSLNVPLAGQVTNESGVHTVGEVLPEIAEPIFGTLQRGVIARAMELALAHEPTFEEMDALYINGSMERFLKRFREIVEPRIASGALNESHRKEPAVIEALAVELAPLIQLPEAEQAA